MTGWLLVLAACSGHDAKPPVPEPSPPETSARGPLVFEGAVPKNLVMLSIDTLRHDVMGRYDTQGRKLSPFMDEIASQGVAVDHVVSCSDWTVASTACMLSGTDNVSAAAARGMIPILTNTNDVVLNYPEGTPMLASFLEPYGYSSLLLSANNFFGEQKGSAQGYDRFLYSPGSATEMWSNAQAAMEEEPLPEPFFLHMHFFEPHRPYLPPEPWLSEQLEGLPESQYDLSNPVVQAYAGSTIDQMPPEEQEVVKMYFRAYYQAELRWLDEQMRAIWEGLDARGMLDDTLVVIWTDHGEALWEHSYTGHAHLLFPNENDVTVYFWAKNLRPGTFTDPVETIDIVPTLLSMWDRPIPPEVTGIPLGMATQGSEERVRMAFTDAFAGPVHSARQGQWLLQFSWMFPDALVLTDLEADPQGVNNLYDANNLHPMVNTLWPYIEAEALTVEPWVLADPRAFTLTWPAALHP